MNKSPLTTILTAALGLSAFASLILCYLNIQYIHQARAMRQQVMKITVERNLVLALGNDVVEYSKKNPAILPVLQSAGISIQNNATKSTK